MNEIPPTSPETPATVPPVVPPVETPATVPAPPPAASLVLNGVKSESEIQLETKLTAAERRAVEAERKAAELERDNQELKNVTPKPAPVKKVKRWKFPMPVIGGSESDD